MNPITRNVKISNTAKFQSRYLKTPDHNILFISPGLIHPYKGFRGGLTTEGFISGGGGLISGILWYDSQSIQAWLPTFVSSSQYFFQVFPMSDTPCVWPTFLKLRCITNFIMLFFVKWLISLVDKMRGVVSVTPLILFIIGDAIK